MDISGSVNIIRGDLGNLYLGTLLNLIRLKYFNVEEVPPIASMFSSTFVAPKEWSMDNSTNTPFYYGMFN